MEIPGVLEIENVEIPGVNWNSRISKGVQVPSNGAALNNFQCFFSKWNWLHWSHGSNITNLNHYSLSFPDAKMTASLRMRCVNTTKEIQICPIKMGRLWTKRDSVARKTNSNFSCQNSNNLWHAQINQWFLHIPGYVGRN